MPENTVFVNIDFSQNKDVIDKALESDNVEFAKQESQKILDMQEQIKQNVKAVGGKSVFDTSLNMIVYVPYDRELIESLADIYVQDSGDLTNLGIGRTILETQDSIHSAQIKGKGNIVLYTNAIREDLRKNQEFYKRSEKKKFDLGISDIIKSALLELKIITTDEKVYDIFFKLVKEHNLNMIEELQSFFYKPLEELKSNIRDIYQAQKTAGIKFAVKTNDTQKIQDFPGHTEIDRSRKQKSPYRKHNWLTIEDYNQNAVDWRKTDVQYTGENVTTDSQNMSMGGEPGNSISVT